MKTLPVSFNPRSADRKLSPIQLRAYGQAVRLSPKPVPPFCASTYVSIDATCPSACRFKKVGCYVRAGFTASMSKRLDHAAERLSGNMVNIIEAAHVKASFRGGRIPDNGAGGPLDLRFHVGGDVASALGARELADAYADWVHRGGGSGWTFTARWRTIPRSAFGRISVLASVQTVADALKARARGYAPALTVRSFPSDRAYHVRGGRGLRVIPCPGETRKTTCVQCRLCLDRDLLGMNVAIGFAIHGRQAERARRHLPVIREVA